ncbi:hypothetical protein V1511DRAFT_521212 [Dipodascopsis uninucleata]
MLTPNTFIRLASASKFTCSRCLSNRRYYRGGVPVTQKISRNSKGSARAEDIQLQRVFDSLEEWQSFLASSRHSSTGLLHNAELQGGYESLAYFAAKTYKAAKNMTEKLLNLKSDNELKGAIKLFDRLSDMLCRVIDLAEFIRSVHPDERFVQTAEYAHDLMMRYMIELNSNDQLYHLLTKVLQTPSVQSSLSEEENIVAKLLLHDFDKSGAALPENKRTQVIEVQQRISELSRAFNMNHGPAQDSVRFNLTELQGMDPTILYTLRGQNRFRKTVDIPSTGPFARMVLESVQSEDVRKRLYIASKTSSIASIETLEDLLESRRRLSRILGMSNYAEYQLSDKMAQTPESVYEFLDKLAISTKPLAQRELDKLSPFRGGDITRLNAWDRDYYASKLVGQVRARIRSPDFLDSYFSVGRVMQGISRLFTRLYGLRFVARAPAADEIWHEDVRPLDVINENGDRVGILYCDLFARNRKPPAPAHYTIRCSRAIASEELHDNLDDSFQNIPIGEDTHGHMMQIPTVALVCDFSGRRNRKGPTLLSFGEVETLFHEMGHAIHSMLGQTELHNISGTRCATDFVELPSVLMESFAACPDVLALYARHYETESPLPYNLLEAHISTRSLFKHVDTYSQIELALLDYSLHTSEGDGKVDSTSIYHELDKQRSLYPPVSEACWQGMFGHLVGYGAVYYSYLFDRVLASLVWQRVFNSGRGSLDREAGERFRNEVLSRGGGRDPWISLAAVLNEDSLHVGGPNAMKFVVTAAGGQL